jgi:DNA replication protein DnaC
LTCPEFRTVSLGFWTHPRRGELARSLAEYTHPPVLVIDEVGYLTVGGDAANLMFQVVNERYLQRRPMLFTTNKPLAAWGLVLHDLDLAEAILDRVLERGRLCSRLEIEAVLREGGLLRVQ